MEAEPTAQNTNSGANTSSIKSDDSSPHNDGGRGSPPPNCAICLGTCRNKSFTDSCLHQFCFKCLLTWSKVKAECPLCKQNFRSIIHNVRSNHQYEEYLVEQRQTEEIAERIDLDSIVNATRRFRYRTTLTLPRRESIAIQQLLLRYPLMADVFPSATRRRRSPASFRRTVYRYNLWARPLPDFTGRFRDCSPEFFRYNESQQTRLVPWLNRELQYLLNENEGHISYVISRILLLVPQYHINSFEFRDSLRRYFGDRTDHFVHEMYCFASTPYDMTGYDRYVQYSSDTRVSTMVNEVLSSSESDASADSDIVMISSSEPADLPPGPSRAPATTRAPVYPQNSIHQPTTTTAPLATPSSSNIIPIETISQSDTDDDSSEVMVVGYIKPPQDRTPEVVDLLGSDSDVIVQDTAPSPSAPQEESQETRAAALVMLSMRSQKARQRDSDSDSAYTPSPPSLTAPSLARRRRHSRQSASTPDTCRTTLSSTPSHRQSSDTTITYRTQSSDDTSDSCCTREDSESSDCETPPRKQRRLDTYTERSKRKWTPQRRTPRNSGRVSKERKRKSSSGKGVKVSKTSQVKEQPEALDRAGPSGCTTGTGSKQRRPSRESKRLKSVVKVINSQKNSCESSSKSGLSLRKRDRRVDTRLRHKRSTDTEDSDSDSEDNLPLNLTIGASSST